MPRSATDATRFTSTTPHASAKVPPSAARLGPSQKRKPGPAGETPQEKVKRLRAAAVAAKNAQISTVDKIILRGRVWADRAHRFTALTLIGATFIAGGVTVYALGDMMIYNRRKRAEFFTERKAQHETAIHTARKAIKAGNATEEQAKFLEMEDAHQAEVDRLAAEKAQKKGVFKRGSEWLFSGLKKEEHGGDAGSGESKLGNDTLSKASNLLGETEGAALAIEDKAKQAFANEKERQRTGGPLDRLGAPTTDPASREEPPKSGGWTSFMTRRS